MCNQVNNQTMKKEIIKYLAENKDQYSKESLVEELRKAGYSERQIESSVKFAYSKDLNGILRCVLAFLLIVAFSAVLGGYFRAMQMGRFTGLLNPYLFPVYGTALLGAYNIFAYGRRKYVFYFFISSILASLESLYELSYSYRPVKEWIRVDAILILPLFVLLLILSVNYFSYNKLIGRNPAFGRFFSVILLIGFFAGGFVGYSIGYQKSSGKYQKGDTICSVEELSGLYYEDYFLGSYRNHQGKKIGKPMQIRGEDYILLSDEYSNKRIVDGVKKCYPHFGVIVKDEYAEISR